MKLVIGKREHYIAAWQGMYWVHKAAYNTDMYDGVNPMLNKTPLKTELDNVCAIAVLEPKDILLPQETLQHPLTQKAIHIFRGLPVGIHSMLITRNAGRNGTGSVKVIGKQWAVAPDQMNSGIGATMLLFLEDELVRAGYTWYYIGCSSMSSRIMRKFGREPYDGSDEHDLYKFNIKINNEDVNRHISDTMTKEGENWYRHKKSKRLWTVKHTDGFALLENPEKKEG